MKPGLLFIMLLIFACGIALGMVLPGRDTDELLSTVSDSDYSTTDKNPGSNDDLLTARNRNEELQAELDSTRAALQKTQRTVNAQEKKLGDLVAVDKQDTASEREDSNRRSSWGNWGNRQEVKRENLTPEQARAKAVELRLQFNDAWKSGKRDDVVKLLYSMQAVGPEGYADLVQMLNQVQEDRHSENQLEFDGRALYGLIRDDEFKKYIAVDTTAEEGLRLAAIRGSGWGRNNQDEDMQPIFRDLLQNDPSSAIVIQAANRLGRMGDTEAVPLIRNALNTSNYSDPDFEEMVYALGNIGSTEAINTIDDFARGASTPEQRDIAIAALNFANPPADGLWLSSVEGSGQAAQSGLQKGDIIVSYNQQDVTDFRVFRGLTQATNGMANVPVQYYRGQSLRSINVPGGKLGIYGEGVTKK